MFFLHNKISMPIKHSIYFGWVVDGLNFMIILIYYCIIVMKIIKKKPSRFIIEISIVKCPILHKIVIVLNCPIQKHLKGKVQPHVVPNLFDRYTHTHLFCSTEERNSYNFGTTWRWVNDKFHFWVNYPLIVIKKETLNFYVYIK